MTITTRYSGEPPALHFADSGGNGPTLLLLHGVTRCGRDWEPILPALTTTWRVISLDHRGHGESARVENYFVVDSIPKYLRPSLKAVGSKATTSLMCSPASTVQRYSCRLTHSLAVPSPMPIQTECWPH